MDVLFLFLVTPKWTEWMDVAPNGTATGSWESCVYIQSKQLSVKVHFQQPTTPVWPLYDWDPVEAKTESTAETLAADGLWWMFDYIT